MVWLWLIKTIKTYVIILLVEIEVVAVGLLHFLKVLVLPVWMNSPAVTSSLTLLFFFSLSLSVQDLGQVEISTALPVYLNHCGSCWPASPAFSSSVNTAVLLSSPLLSPTPASLPPSPPSLRLTDILIATLLPTLLSPDCLHHTKTLCALEHCLQILWQALGYE